MLFLGVKTSDVIFYLFITAAVVFFFTVFPLFVSRHSFSFNEEMKN